MTETTRANTTAAKTEAAGTLPADLDGLLAGFPTATREAWLKAVERVLKGADFDATLVTRTRDGIAVPPLVAPAPGTPADAILSRPAAPWTIFQRVDHPDPAEAAALARDDLGGGANGLTLVFSRTRSARGFGLPASDPKAVADALDGIALDQVALRLDAGPDGLDAARQVLALAERQRLELGALDVDFGFDASGTGAWAGQDGTALTPAIGGFVAEIVGRGFKGRALLADGRPWHEAGGTEGQELGAVLASGLAKLKVLTGAGLDIEAARRQIAFLLVADVDLYGTVAKLRAFRRLWARVEHACGLAPRPIRLHAETAWRMMTRRDPWSNLLRTSLAVLGAGLGGADAVQATPFTAALGLPDAFARRLARHLGTLMIEEANLTRVADPAAGAGAIEALTDGYERAGWDEFRAIEADGGLLASLAAGRFQARLATAREGLEAEVADGRRPIVGTTLYPDPRETPVAVLAPAPDLEIPAGALPSIRLAAPHEAGVAAPTQEAAR